MTSQVTRNARPTLATVLWAALLAAALAACNGMTGAESRPGAASSRPSSSQPDTKAPAEVAVPGGDEDAIGGGGSAGPTAAPIPAPGRAGRRSAAAAATPAPSRPSGAGKAQRFAMILYRPGDFVAQYTFEWCVGASLQMALNMATPRNDGTRASQARLWAMARDRSASPFGGANARGWAAALNELGVGPYRLVSLPTFDEALRVAAGAIRATERPVGLVMWRGRHAWVMSGFESVGDPRAGRDFRVTGVRVLDPLHPHGSRAWGPSPKPNSLLTPSVLARQYVIRDRGRVNLGVPPGYLLVLPIPEA